MELRNRDETDEASHLVSSLELWFATRGGIGTAITQWWQGAGLLDAEVPGVVDDFGTSLDATGRVWAGTGNPDTDVGFTTIRDVLRAEDAERHATALTQAQ
jgi:hypothetical protein